ncbi:MAG TPA: hypothetical protein VII43_08385, partial [Opitutaceae bacterium]
CLEGTYSEIYPNIGQDELGLRRLFTQFSFPGGIPSHASPECPGSIHEGGELGYSISHPFGTVFDNPSLVVACVVGDGEAETGPLSTAWDSNKFLDAATDGAVLPILHLNGYKEEDTVTTPFAMTFLNELDRFHLVMDAVDRLPQTSRQGHMPEAAAQGQAGRAQAVHRPERRGHAGDPELEMGRRQVSAQPT